MDKANLYNILGIYVCLTLLFVIILFMHVSYSYLYFQFKAPRIWKD